MKNLSLIIDIVLGLGILMVLNDNPDNFTPNFIGLACLGLMILKHRHDIKTQQQ